MPSHVNTNTHAFASLAKASSKWFSFPSADMVRVQRVLENRRKNA